MPEQAEAAGLKIQYIATAGGAAIVSCNGAGPAAILPEEIDGLPVCEICAYAFSSAETAKSHLPKDTQIRTASVGPPPPPGSREQFLHGALLREVSLPGSVALIGEYAFYNCTALTRLCLGGGAARIGNGAFMNCAALHRVHFSVPPDAETCLPGLLAEIPREMRIEFCTEKESAVLIFPEYYEESVENAPARIFEHIIEGVGYRYRECFQGARLDAREYDVQFPTACVEAAPQTLLRIALGRLRFPYLLTDGAKRQYLDYLAENALPAAELLIADDDPEGLVFLAASGALTPENMGGALRAAALRGRTECMSVLVNEQHRRFPPKEKIFDL